MNCALLTTPALLLAVRPCSWTYVAAAAVLWISAIGGSADGAEIRSPDQSVPESPAAAQSATPMPTNRLINETSPYLLQHAHNPVDWFPWGNEAFAQAKLEDKPIFLSIGYSTCYWCHVMEKESFEDSEVAAVLNEHFIAIKVDREERPDLDEQYMVATQLMTGRGGWPNSVWLMPDGKPWMAGTYFPKPQFISALNQLAGVWKTRRSEVAGQAANLAEAIAKAGNVAATTGSIVELDPEFVALGTAALAARFEPRHGGFGDAPKFPPHGTLQLLIHRYRETGDETLLEPITKTLDAMWLGGLHDHIGGGFHRYSTDERWLLPHFEKMLYDNAQLMQTYAAGFLATGNSRYREAVGDIFRWVEREMTSPQGAFYSAIDSGEVGGEGEAYVWRLDQVQNVLGSEDGTLFADIYNFEAEGNFVEQATQERPGTNIPHLDQAVDEMAAARVAAMRDRLLVDRLTWPQPHKDDKTLTSWNGLMIGALAYSGRVLNEPRYTDAAARAANFTIQTMFSGDRLLRTYRNGEAKLPGYLDDYAYFAQGLIELHRATSEARWLEQADRLGSILVADFQDQQNGGFFFTTESHEDLIMRSKGLSGGGNVPNANGIAAQVLLDLADLTNKQEYAVVAKRTLESMAGLMTQNPSNSEHLLLATAEYLGKRDSAHSQPIVNETAPPEPDVSVRIEPVTIEAFASRLSIGPGESIQVAIAIDIDEGWHLYGENLDADFVIPSNVSIETADRLEVGELVGPEPHEMMDPVLQRTLNTYTGRIWFRVPITVAAEAEAGATVLDINVTIQACDDTRCLQPQTATLHLPFAIDPEASPAIRHPSVFSPTSS